MDMAKAFGKVNRTIPWVTLYKKGLPKKMITQIRRGHQKTTLRPKRNGTYEKPAKNNVGVSQ